MIYYPLQTLVNAGVKDIMLVTGGPYAGDFLRLLGDGKEFGLQELHYAYQEGEDGIAKALSLSRHFVGGDKVCVILGDNILQADIGNQVREFAGADSGAHLFLKEVERPERFGVACLDDRSNLVAIEEKPQTPRSSYAVIGVYLYDSAVFDIIDTLTPSARGEYEITDVSNHYIASGRAGHSFLQGWWTDAGTFESLHQAGKLVREFKSSGERVEGG
jgi:glucose-1-phosphate thymidylyltransferase